MTEPLLFGTTLLAVALTADWLDRGAQGWPTSAGLALVAACMTRYEAWPICGSAGCAGAGRAAAQRHAARGVRQSQSPGCRLTRRLRSSLFLLNSRWTVGAWFVSSGFFVAENEALGRPLVAWEQVREGVYRLSGPAVVWPAYAAAALVVVDVCALARSRLARARSRARRCRRAAVVRVRRRSSLPHSLRRPARGRVRGARRHGNRAPAAAACAPSPPHSRSQVRCGRSRHSNGRRRSSPNRNETRRTSSDDERSPNTCGRITTAGRS